MPASIILWLLTALLCLTGTVSAFAQAGETNQEVRELQEPAPEAVEVYLGSPAATAEEVEWQGDEKAEEGPAEPEEEEGRETFGDRFRRGDLFGWFDAQARFFPQQAGNPLGIPPSNDYWFNGSLAWEPGFFMNVTDYMNFELILFGRVDQHDRNRTHGDIREGFFELFFDEWSLGFGIPKVFWGVTESRHLVDIINQNDLV